MQHFETNLKCAHSSLGLEKFIRQNWHCQFGVSTGTEDELAWAGKIPDSFSAKTRFAGISTLFCSTVSCETFSSFSNMVSSVSIDSGMISISAETGCSPVLDSFS